MHVWERWASWEYYSLLVLVLVLVLMLPC